MKIGELKTGASLCFNRRLDLDDLKAAKAAGIECVELSFNYDGYFNVFDLPNRAEEYKAMAEEAGVELWSLHLPFSGLYDISQLDDEKRDETMRINKTLMEAASRAGVKVIVIHPSAEPISDDLRPARLVNSRKNLTILAAYAKALGMRLAVEDLPRSCLINHSREAKFMLSDNPDLYIVFDTNHLLGQDNLEFIEEVGDRIISLHVSDYDFIDERHRLPFEGRINWRDLAKALEKKGYCGPWMYEVGSNDGQRTYSDLRNNHMRIAEIAAEEPIVFDEFHVKWVYDRVCADACADGASISAKLNDASYSLAHFRCEKGGVSGNSIYRITYQAEVDNGVRTQIFLNIKDACGKVQFMAHGTPGATFVTPEGAASIEAVVCFTSPNGGKASLSGMTVERIGEPRPHKVKLAAAMFAYDGERTVENNMKVALERIDAAAAEGADLVLLTETVNTRQTKPPYTPAKMDDPCVTMLRDKARQHRMFVAASLRLDRGDGMTSNTALLFDRNGRIVGQYTKTHLTMSETWCGHVAGDDIPVFDTELGRIGFSICWDLFFPEHARAMFMKGVDIILNPTAGKCDFQHRASGYANSAIIVTAQCTDDPALTRITDRKGETLAEADPEKGIAIAEVDINEVVYHRNLSVVDSVTDPRFVYGAERRALLYAALADEKSGYNFDFDGEYEISDAALYFDNWSVVKNNEFVDAHAEADGRTVRAVLNGGRYSVARFFGKVDGLEGNSVYRAVFKSVCGDGVRRNVYYNWKDINGKTLFMGHLSPDITFVSPEGAASLEVTVCFSGDCANSAYLSDLAVEKVGVPEPKKVKLAAAMIIHDGEYTPESNLKVSLERIDAAADKGADLVLLTETVNTCYVSGLEIYQGAVTLDSPFVTALADKARERGIYVAASIRLDEGGLISNTALLFGRDGKLAGRYTKTHHTTTETWGGMVLGDEVPVFDTDIGRIGFSICWDLFFPEHARLLFMKGVDIILNPTYGICKYQHAASAYANGAFIVTANCGVSPELTRITDRRGDDIATADPDAKFAIAEVDINEYNKTFWLSAPDSWTDSRFVFMGERRPDLYGILAAEK